MKVLGIGESVIDMYAIEDESESSRPPAGSTPGDNHIGGSVLAALIFLSRLGVSCEFFTSLGNDNEAAIIKNALRAEKVKLNIHPQEKTKVNTIVVDSKSGQRKKLRSPIKHVQAKYIDADYLQQFDLIITDRHMRDLFYEVVRKKNKNTKILIDTSTEVSEFTKDMVRHADYPIVPVEVLSTLSAEDDMLASVIELYRLSAKPVTVTMGELGSLLYDGRRIELLPSLRVNVVDTNGAGDIYRGAYAYGILLGWSQRKCAEFANVAAGLQCTKFGNVAAIPDKDSVELHLQKPRQHTELHHVHTYFKELCRNRSQAFAAT